MAENVVLLLLDRSPARCKFNFKSLVIFNYLSVLLQRWQFYKMSKLCKLSIWLVAEPRSTFGRDSLSQDHSIWSTNLVDTYLVELGYLV